ncbi:MAG: hypothetical protein HY202_08585 [Nitrospirae bacterium]|nr:hypothetical protein [Nitrospirota bacterium]
MKRLFLVLIVLFLSSIQARGDEYKVQTVTGNQAVIEDESTGEQITVKKGDELKDGWTVSEITPQMISIDKDLGTHKIRKEILVPDQIIQEIKKDNSK